ncbi:sn-glycerol-3-phosphate ABC transporter ATP-binding protein UgpC [Aquabacterium sp. A7-Y]|uniref:ABC transporter ATP-binding protein n=1 Tax=Aquabacterium sp. A7-Y TaxID=1349605 RepID=UPI00223C98EA|nr:sn-glycerol-3-phosphate ABC transporter ATP-binding protein UgpC [Aquabacterium sp. A7-Y]MCW7538983.1 sn-glycerol-3-phosphate ABC transporter ATP-binding protein UgpC [Aquabacterium sp. A7-Y]
MAQVTLDGITKRYGAQQAVLQGVDLTIEKGEFVVLVGPSGCGKSTLLRMLSGLEDISEGELRIAGRRVNELPPAQRGIAMVFQSYALYPHMTVYRNMAFGLGRRVGSRAEADRRIREAARVLHIDHLLHRLPRDLSGGQRQRVAIGRAIVRQPELFLFDEPLSNLDAALRVATRVEIARLHRELGVTIVYVTHDQVEAMTLGDKIVVLHEGRIQQAGAPLELYQRPANRFVARFIGTPAMNLLPARVLHVSDREVHWLCPRGPQGEAAVDGSALTVGETVEVGVRPEHLSLGPKEGAGLRWRGRAELVEYLGDCCLVHVRLMCEDSLVVAKLLGAAPEVGAELTLCAPADAVHLFRADGTACRRVPAAGAVQ